MSFAMVTKNCHDKKVRFLEDDGREVYIEDDPYAFLRFQEAGQLRPAKKPKKLDSAPSSGAVDAEADSEDDDEEKLDPEAAISKLEAASSELAVLIDLIDNVSTLRAVMVQYADARRDDSKKKADAVRNKANMVKDKALQVETKQRQLQAAAARCRSAAQLLRRSAQRENRFVAELAALQSFWSLRRQPGNAWAPYAVELYFPLSHSSGADERLPAGAAAKERPPRIPSETLAIVQGFEGNVVVAAPSDASLVPTVQGSADGSAQAITSQPASAVGVQEVHALLKERLLKLTWRAVEERLVWESNLHMHALFAQPLISRTLQQIAAPGSRSKVKLFKPVATSLMVTRLAPEASLLKRFGHAAQKRPRGDNLAASLLAYWQHQYFVALLFRSLDQQVQAYPGAVVSMRTTGSLYTMAALVDGGHRGSLVVCCRRMSYGVQAMPHSSSPINNSCWLSEHCLRHVSQQELGGILKRYWGPDDARASDPEPGAEDDLEGVPEPALDDA